MPAVPDDIASYLAFANASMALRSVPGRRHTYYPLRVSGFPRAAPRYYAMRGPPAHAGEHGNVLLRISAEDRAVYAGRRSMQPLCHLRDAPFVVRLHPDKFVDPREYGPRRVRGKPLTRANGQPLLPGDILVYLRGQPGTHAFLNVDHVFGTFIRVSRLRRAVSQSGEASPGCVYGPSTKPLRIRRDGLVPINVAGAAGRLAQHYDPTRVYTDTQPIS